MEYRNPETAVVPGLHSFFAGEWHFGKEQRSPALEELIETAKYLCVLECSRLVTG